MKHSITPAIMFTGLLEMEGASVPPGKKHHDRASPRACVVHALCAFTTWSELSGEGKRVVPALEMS